MSGQTGRIAGAIVGAVAAYYTFGASTVLTGAALGSAIGGTFDKTKTEGPRLDNLKVQQSNYGVGIPTLYGTERATPNVIWSTDKIELPFTTSQGKGGGNENTNWRSFVHMRHILCETPRDGSTVSLVKIFQDGKLIWDASSGISIGSALASAENLFASFILYQGHQDQMPNAEEEAWLGVGNVPAYRGVVSIYMRAIECPGGRVPQFSFVCSNSLNTSSPVMPFWTVSLGPQQFGGVCVSDGAYHYQYDSTSGVGRVIGYRVGNGYSQTLWQSSFPGSSNNQAILPIVGAKNKALRARNPQSGPDASKMFVEVLDLTTGGVSSLVTLPLASLPQIVSSGSAAYDPISGAYAFSATGVSAASPIFVVNADGSSTSFTGVSGYCAAIGFYNSQIVALSCTSPGTATGGSMTFVSFDATGTLLSSVSGPAGSNWNSQASAIQVDAGGVYLYLNDFTLSAGWVYKQTAGVGWTQLSAVKSYRRSSGVQNVSPHFFTDGMLAVTGPHIDDGSYDLTVFATYAPIPVKAKDIIADQCQRAGNLTYDVSAIPDSDTVIGYELKGPASARTNIDPLLTCFGIYAVDEDGATKFKKLSAITSVATVTFDELGQTEGDVVDAMPLARTQEIDLPRSVTISYVEAGLDYQTASETSVRQVTKATEDVSIDLPMAITSDQAKAASLNILFARWRSQNTRTCSVSRKFAFVSPGDGVTIEYPRGTSKMWRVMSANDTGALIEWSVEPADSQLFTQTAIGATGYAPQQVDPLAPPTQMQIVDTSILQDADNNAGTYVCLSAPSAGWTGAELWVGPDATSLASRGTVQNEAINGFAESALGSGPTGVVDETNTVVVNVGGHFTLSSITRDVLLAGSTNVAAIGAAGRWEIIKFQRATSLGGGRYTLSGLMRGQRGTEWAIGTHQAADTFVVLATAGMLRPSASVGQIGMSLLYEAVSKGRPQESATTLTYATTGEGLKPFSPYNLRKSFSGNDIALTWSRRTRMADNWAMGIVPLGETSERYDVVIYSDNTFTTVKRVYTVNATAATYYSADQVTDFGSNQSTVNVRVYQVSDSIGRGHELQVTL